MRVSAILSLLFALGLGVRPRARDRNYRIPTLRFLDLTVIVDNQGLISGTTYDFQLLVKTDANYVNQGDTTLADEPQSISFDVSDSGRYHRVVDTAAGLQRWRGNGVDGSGSTTSRTMGTATARSAEAASTCLQEFDHSATEFNNLRADNAVTTDTWDLTISVLGGTFSDSSSVRLFIADLGKCTGRQRPTCTWETEKPT